MYTISFIIPVFNPSEDMLRRCVESVLNQTGGYELILVDDGSRAEIASLCDEYRDFSNIKIIHKKNGGVSSARNVGIANAEGEWLCFVDCDDWIEPDTVSILSEKADPLLCDLIYFSTKRFTDQSVERCQTLPGVSSGTYLTAMQWQKAMLDFAANGFYETEPPHGFLAVWGKLFRTDFIKENNIKFDEKLKIAEDVCFNMDALREETRGVLYIDEPLYDRYSNMASAFHKYYSDIVQNDWYFLKHLRRSLKKTDVSDSLQQLALYKRYVICLFGILDFDMAHKDNPKRFEQRLKDFISVSRRSPYSIGIERCSLKWFGRRRKIKILLLRKCQEALVLRLAEKYD